MATRFADRAREPLLIVALVALAGSVVTWRAVRPPSAPLAPVEPPGQTLVPPTALEQPSGSAAPAAADAGSCDPREEVLARMARELDFAPETLARLRRIFARSPALGQGNPTLTVHPMTREECRAIRERAGVGTRRSPECGAVNMAPLYDPDAGQTASDAQVCIDQFEFPNLECEYPFVHVTAREAVQLCEALGKRLCDAHEWEGACAGGLRSPAVEYDFAKSRYDLRIRHNAARTRVWAYGKTKDHGKCATKSSKSPSCVAGGYRFCGSNTYPTGAFPECVSRFGVYDQHGNAAEHMSLPLRASELGARGGHGWTEMKGSWFIFSRTEAHEDDCRWRAPDWHGSRTTDPKSHSNYHLGFRCCRDVTPRDR